MKVYPMLSGSKLKTELSLLYSKEEFKACCGAVDLLQLFVENNLEEHHDPGEAECTGHGKDTVTEMIDFNQRVIEKFAGQ